MDRKGITFVDKRICPSECLFQIPALPRVKSQGLALIDAFRSWLRCEAVTGGPLGVRGGGGQTSFGKETAVI